MRGVPPVALRYGPEIIRFGEDITVSLSDSLARLMVSMLSEQLRFCYLFVKRHDVQLKE